MRTIGLPTRVASFVGAVALLMQIAPAQATGWDRNRPVDITFTKWGVAAPVPHLYGFVGDLPDGSFVGEVLWRQASLFNDHVVGLTAMYEFVDLNRLGEDGDRSFTALIRGGQNAKGAAHFDGVILAGWRAGARVEVVYQRYGAVVGMRSCERAPINTNCFEGTIHVGRALKD